MSKLTAVIGGLLLSASSTAHAEWQYTKWGMTPAQVASASHGTTQVGSGIPDDKYDGAEVGAVGTYSSGDYKFRAVFYFVAGKLTDVRLSLLSGEKYALKNGLLGVYGRSFDETPSIGLTTWHDVPKNNRIYLLMIGNLTSLEYRPLRDEGASGL